MDENTQGEKSVQQKSPTELLNSQTQSLSVLVEIQRMMDVHISEIKHYDEKIIEQLTDQKKQWNH